MIESVDEGRWNGHSRSLRELSQTIERSHGGWRLRTFRYRKTQGERDVDSGNLSVGVVRTDLECIAVDDVQLMCAGGTSVGSRLNGCAAAVSASNVNSVTTISVKEKHAPCRRDNPHRSSAVLLPPRTPHHTPSDGTTTPAANWIVTRDPSYLPHRGLLMRVRAKNHYGDVTAVSAERTVQDDRWRWHEPVTAWPSRWGGNRRIDPLLMRLLGYFNFFLQCFRKTFFIINQNNLYEFKRVVTIL